MSLTKHCILEINDLSHKAERLARGSVTDRKQADVLLQRIGHLRSVGLSSHEIRAQYSDALSESVGEPKATEQRYQKAFENYIYSGGNDDAELRDLLVGTQSITYTDGAMGGYVVPILMEKQIFEALAQVDPILDENVTHFTMTPSVTLQPQTITGWDLSSISASLIAEATQQVGGTMPTVAGRVLRANIVYKVSLGVSFEAEDDVSGLMTKMARAYGVAMGRRIGSDYITGNGTTQPQGLLTALPSPTYATGSGKLVLADFLQAYFSVNRIYRSMPKCAWLCADSVYERIRAATDNSGRPLLSVENDRGMLLGRPIYVSPSVTGVGGSPASNGILIFGDLDHFHIRTSRPTLQRTTQQSINDVTKGESLWVGRMRADSALFDPSGGNAPPITSITVTN